MKELGIYFFFTKTGNLKHGVIVLGYFNILTRIAIVQMLRRINYLVLFHKQLGAECITVQLHC